MALAIAAGGAALAAYLDARFHIRNDYRLGNQAAGMSRYTDLFIQKAREGKLLIYNILEDRAGTAMGDLVFLVFEGREWTYTDFYEALQPVGNWLMNDLGIQKGEMVALDGANSPEYIMLWFALEAIGAKIAFINCNLTADPLVHCVKISGARYILADSDVRQLVSPVEQELASLDTQTIYYSPATIESLTDTTPLPSSRREGMNPLDTAALIYTSGTTGMPKGTVVSHGRQLVMAQATIISLELKPGDRMYTCLPLYHASAMGLCCLKCLGAGATMVLSRKFSHNTFWPEVNASKATHIQYVGELCRYLLNAPPSPLDTSHSVHTAWGNGLRVDVWEPFRQRFGIECIHELYAATDGMSFTTNPNRGDFSRGAIALRGPLWHWWNGDREKRVRIDPDTQEIVRGRDGFAIECKAGEAGETVWRLDPSNPDLGSPTYHGNHEAAVKRRAADLFKRGDLWMRSGDMLRLDADHRLYFVDRLGDTFRWHSENVAANEVGDVVGMFPQIAEANVYGVLVPHADGRAGCAAIVATEGTSTDSEAIASGRGLDLKGLAEHCLAKLPRYAVPIFVRVVKQLEYTATMKLTKGRLRSEGIDLEAIEKGAREKGEAVDAMYWLAPGQPTYVPFSSKDLQELRNGKVRL
ncbi:fatty-acyl-CoA synthase [Xylariaceae sp. FL0662B]|nr:fatty-acyl-CoA synthase [Xylariaceae sp. FL0662B]